MKLTKGKIVTFISVGGAVIVLLLLSAFLDLAIAESIYNPLSVFGEVFDVLGQAPCYLMVALCLSFTFAYSYKKSGKKFLTISILSVTLSVVIWFVIINIYFGSIFKLWQVILISLPLNALLLAFINFSEVSKEKLFKFALFTLCLICLSILINQGLKFIWGRYRFNDLYKAGALSNFTPWWQIRGVNGNKSFPSGHTTAATTMFCLMYLLELFNAKKKVKISLCVMLALYVIGVAYSRMVIGAHYLSDVTVGFGVTFVIFLLCYNVSKKLEEKFAKKVTNEKE